MTKSSEQGRRKTCGYLYLKNSAVVTERFATAGHSNSANVSQTVVH